MMPAPPGFPKYSPGEEVVLFLRPAASWTGFRMPAGVAQGKFVLGPGRVANGTGNVGLFSNVHIDKDLTTDNEKRMMAVTGAANPATFLAFVRRAVQERWIERGRMMRADRAAELRLPPQSESFAPGDQPPVQQDATTPQTAPLDPDHDISTPRSGR
jgi:hypothetical protein